MSNGSFQNEDVMEDYLTALLTDDEPVVSETVQREAVERLLEKVEPAAAKTASAEQSTKSIESATIDAEKTTATPAIPAKEKAPSPVVQPPVIETLPQIEIPDDVDIAVDTLKELQEGEFQALFFDVAGLTLAVPLTHLGGIHNLEKPSPLFGKPNWYMGVMVHREQKLNTVDTARWVMPERYDNDLEDSLNYQYLIMLGESPWGLACEKLINTVTLKPDDVKWRAERGKRPWLAGMVKEKMCALLDISQLVDMLDKGLTSNDQ